MSKLLKFKEWLTLEDAAKHLSQRLSEEVSRADLLQLALDGHLTLSVHFVNRVPARIGKIIPLEQAAFKVIPGLVEGMEVHVPLGGVVIAEKRFFQHDGDIHLIDGVWDLLMAGDERLAVENLHGLLLGGAALDAMTDEGAFVCRPTGEVALLLDFFEEDLSPEELDGAKPWRKTKRHYYPGHLPEGTIPTVRTTVLEAFASKLNNEEQLPTARRDAVESCAPEVIAPIVGEEALLSGLQRRTRDGMSIGMPGNDVALIFGLLRERMPQGCAVRTQQQWLDAISKNMPGWLRQHRLDPGERGKRQSSFDALRLAKALVEGRAGNVDRVPPRTMNQLFLERRELAPWKDEWDRYHEAIKELGA